MRVEESKSVAIAEASSEVVESRWMSRDGWVTFIREEGGYACRGMGSVVVCEFRERKEGKPSRLVGS